MNCDHPRVLVVDGEADQRESLASLLLAGGFDVSQAGNALHAVEKLNASGIDAIVVDVRLPDAAGADVLACAAARNPALPSILVAGLNDVKQAASVARDTLGFVVKPYQLPQVPRLLRAEFDRRRLEEENADLRARLQGPVAFPEGIPDEGINFTSLVSHLERDLILRCLEKTGGNKRQAARLLRLSRTTLIDKIHRIERREPAPAA